jgi:outer membrane protein assembly complex protein YaeT
MLLCGAAGLAQNAPLRKLIVADIIISGNKRMATDVIKGMLKSRVGGEYIPETVQEDVRTLMATRQFGNVEARFKEVGGNKVTLYFFVVDFANTVEEVVYEGVHSIKKSELESLTGVKKGAPLNPSQNRVACQSIVNRLRDKGRHFASCVLKEGDKPGDKRVVFSVTEGPEIYVRSIEFEGNQFVGGAVLKTHINSKERLLGINLISTPYIPAMADHDVDELLKYYRSYGFHDVRVSRQVKWDPDSKTVVLIYHIHEGLRYRLQGPPTIEGEVSRSRAELEPLILAKGYDYYSEDKTKADVKRLEEYIGFYGVRAAVQEQVYFTGPGQCAIHYQVQERPPALVGQIFIVGNTTTRQNVILRQIPLFPGQPLSYPALAQAERNLARLGIFESTPEVHPTVTVIDPDTDSPYKDILVNVQETRTGSLMFGVGFNSNAGATGSIVLQERNFDLFRFPTSFDDLFSGGAFRGAGQDFRIEAVPGTQLQRYTIQLREPFLFDSPYSLTTSGYYYTRIFNEYTEQRLGSRLTLGRRLDENWTVSLTGRVENVAARDISLFAPPTLQDIEGNNLLYSGRIGATFDRRDSFLRPTAGQVLDFGFEEAGGRFTFPQATADFNQYFTLWQRADGSGKHVLAFHSQLGWSGDNTPAFERFYAGGFRSIRGFQFRGVGPNINGFEVGGDFMFLNSLEYQIPVRASDNVYFVTFVDSGTVEPRVEIKDYRVSAGFGVRFVIPMLGPVPIALDFGFPIVKAQGDREQVFSFWLGFFR